MKSTVFGQSLKKLKVVENNWRYVSKIFPSIVKVFEDFCEFFVCLFVYLVFVCLVVVIVFFLGGGSFYTREKKKKKRKTGPEIQYPSARMHLYSPSGILQGSMDSCHL